MQMDEIKSLLDLLNAEFAPKAQESAETVPDPGHPLKTILVIKDGIRGHINQSLGVAEWLARRTGAEVLEVDIPELRGGRRLRAKLSAYKLLNGNRRKAREWLSFANGEGLIRQVGQWFSVRNIREGDVRNVLFLSAGTLPAFFNIALGYIWRCTSATIMTPGVLGTALFDFAIVPEHDCPGPDSNILTTLGAPNRIVRDELGEAAAALERDFPPQKERRWGVLIGGDDANYRITRRWVHRTLGRILHLAELNGVDVYIATSRRTSAEAEEAVRRLVTGRREVRFLLLGSKDPSNPVPGILGLCDEVFCTEDSVNMVSEAVTAGHRVILLRTERRRGLRGRLQALSAFGVRHGLAPRRFLFGIPRFNTVFSAFKKDKHLIELGEWIREQLRDAPLLEESLPVAGEPEEFNEARRAADWMLEHWEKT